MAGPDAAVVEPALCPGLAPVAPCLAAEARQAAGRRTRLPGLQVLQQLNYISIVRAFALPGHRCLGCKIYLTPSQE